MRRLFTLTRALLVLGVVLFTLAFNLLTFAYAPLAGLMLAAVQKLAVQPVLSTASELAAAKDREKDARRRSDKLQQDLETERKRYRRAADANTSLKSSNVTLKNELDDLKKTPRLSASNLTKIDILTTRIVRRSSINATRNLASMVLEGIPVVGALTIVSVTALEVSDACETAREMGELRGLANLPDVENSDLLEACAKIPTLSLSATLTLQQCRKHAQRMEKELGKDAAAPVHHKCDCLELPDGCPGEDLQTVKVPPPAPTLP